MSNDLWLAIECFFDSSQNWTLRRRYEASLADRIEGFTETFGESSATESSFSQPCWEHERDSVAQICATEHPPQLLRLFQYRPAWKEQLALNAAGVPYVVINSKYATSETSGPLPVLQDLKTDPPAMMGTLSSQASGRLSESAILDYIKQTHKVDLDRILSDVETKHESFALRSLISQILDPCLIVLQFQDKELWRQTMRERCIRAGGTFAATTPRSERLQALASLSSAQRSLSIDSAVERIRTCYDIFEKHLSKESDLVIFAEGLSLVDVMLWDHLMRALTDMHLVVILGDFPNLVDFVLRLWHKYFSQKENSWQKWNSEQNERNPFFNVPSLAQMDAKNKNCKITLQSAMDVMEHLSNRDRNLKECLLVARQAKSLQQEPKQVRPLGTWDRWRQGGTMFPYDAINPRKSDEGNEAQSEATKREYKSSDEIWMASVLAASSVVLLMFSISNRAET